MMSVSKKLLWQQGFVAQYAEIDLAVNPSDGVGRGVVIPDHILPHWSNAINFAVALFAETYAWQLPVVAEMTVRVQSIRAVPGDTTLCALAYVTFQALCSAWNVDGEQVFSFNQSSGSYSFNLPTLGASSPTPV